MDKRNDSLNNNMQDKDLSAIAQTEKNININK